jgi:hypothetical protein
MQPVLTGIERQKLYLAELRKQKFKYGLTVGAAFVRGIRDIGYRHTGTALAELIDNADQAGATNVHVIFGSDGANSDKKPTQVAVIDDGHGMIPEMTRVAMTWGGTDRENDRRGFGRFGYGLPSAAVSIGRRYTVYSLVEEGKLHAVTVDLDDIEAGAYMSPAGDIVVPSAKLAKLPAFVERHIARNFPGRWAHGTVVVIEKIDRLRWKTAGALEEHLLRHFGVTYHKMRQRLDIWVNDTRCEPIDPLFLSEGCRWFDLDEQRAEALDPRIIDVRDPHTREIVGQIRVRYSYMPFGFGAVDKDKDALGGNQNPRYAVMRDYNGLIISRMGRVIDVVTHVPSSMISDAKKIERLTFKNNDRYIKVEIDFPAALDEEFNVATSKQTVMLSNRIWEVLEQNGLFAAMAQLREKFQREYAARRAQRDQDAGRRRLSEQAMEQAAAADPVPSPAQTEKQRAFGERRLTEEARRRAMQRGISADEAQQQLIFELRGRPYKVEAETLPGAPFFRVDQWGGTKILFLNKASRFFTDVYAGGGSSLAVRSALEVLLFSIGDRILESPQELRDRYAAELVYWNLKLDAALAYLAQAALPEGANPDEQERRAAE